MDTAYAAAQKHWQATIESVTAATQSIPLDAKDFIDAWTRYYALLGQFFLNMPLTPAAWPAYIQQAEVKFADLLRQADYHHAYADLINTTVEWAAGHQQAILKPLETISSLWSDGATATAYSDNTMVGSSARQLITAQDGWSLYHYHSSISPRVKTPLLIVYALVNRPYILDLQPHCSFIQNLLQQGVDIYLLDWGTPAEDDFTLTLQHYVCDRMMRAVQQVLAQHQLAALNLLGICQGGTLSACYSALYPAQIKNLITVTTPIDFHTPDNTLTQLVRNIDISNIVDTFGNIDGALLNNIFLGLKPFRQWTPAYWQTLLARANRDFFAVEKWLFDCPAQAGLAFQQFVIDLFQQNKLVRGELLLGESVVDLQRIVMPILNMYATRDHLVPPTAATALHDYVSSQDYTESAIEGGHISLYVSSRARSWCTFMAEWLLARE
jgi:polyhydroxyalkanoate synthase subunit PhaC